MPKLLTKDEVEFYKENGYVKLSLFTNEEINEISKAYEDVFQRKKNAGMESSWKGDTMKEAAKGNEVSVSFLSELALF